MSAAILVVFSLVAVEAAAPPAAKPLLLELAATLAVEFPPIDCRLTSCFLTTGAGA